tara:strand:- start:14962 stop:15066 length:105 start_codon:yes stop_codon:yes gene_type:complete
MHREWAEVQAMPDGPEKRERLGGIFFASYPDEDQ